MEKCQVAQLTDKNWELWEMQMTVLLKSKKLWSYITGANEKKPDDATKVPAWEAKDLEAQALIITTVSKTQAVHCFKCTTAKEMFDKLKQYNSDSSVSNMQCTLMQFQSYQAKPNQAVKAFEEIEQLAASLNLMGMDIDHRLVQARIVSSLPDSYTMFKKSWASVAEGEKTMSNLLIRLRTEDMENKNQSKSDSEKAEDEAEHTAAFHARKWGRKPDSQQRSDSHHPRGRGRGRGQTRGRGRGGSRGGGRGNSKKGACHYCGKMGHYQRDCWQREEDENNQQSDGEPEQQSSSRGNRKGKSVKFQKSKGEERLAFTGRIEDNESTSISKYDFVSDSGCNQHICGVKEMFTKYENLEKPIPVLGIGQRVRAVGVGQVTVMALIQEEWKEIEINNVLHIPGCTNLFSEMVMDIKFGYSVNKENGFVTYINRETGLPGPTARAKNDMYIMDFRPIEVHAFLSAATWHARLGHINKKYVENTIKCEAAYGISWRDIAGITEKCDPCHLAKDKKITLHECERKMDTRPGEMIHVDLAGPFEKSIGGKNYFLLLMDDATGFKAAYFQKHKDSTVENVISFLKFMETQTGNKAKILKSDNGTEISNKEMKKYLRENGMGHVKSAPYTQAQNGRIERAIQTIKNTARAMLIASNLPWKFWAEAVGTAVFIHNRVLDKTSGNVTAYQQIMKKKPNLHNMKVFGCDAYYRLPDQHRSSWDPKSKKMIFVGYDGMSGNYRLYDPERRDVVIARHVHFEEEIEKQVFVNLKSSSDEENTDTENESEADTSSVADRDDAESTTSFDDDNENISTTASSSPRRKKDTVTVRIETEGGNYRAEIPRNATSTVVIPSGMQLRDRKTILKPQRYSDTEKDKPISGVTGLLAFQTEPTSYAEAMQSEEAPQWRGATEEEMKSHHINGTWKLVKPPPGAKILGCRWVFKHKKDEHGNIIRYKARLCVKGYDQREGIDYNETFAPVVRYESVRILLSLAATYNMHHMQFDVKTAYLNAEVDEKIYMQQPEGFEVDKEFVCLLIKSLYGLKQSGRCWSIKLCKVLKKMKFTRCQTDASVFIYREENEVMYLSIYVDDGAIFSTSKELMMRTLHLLKEHFDIKVSKMNTYIGMEIQMTNEGGIVISQTGYIRELLEKFRMTECNTAPTPMTQEALLPAEKCNNQLPFRQLIGALLFIARTVRPDIAFAVTKLSQFNNAFDATHFTAAKRILRYLKGTMYDGLYYAPGNRTWDENSVNILGYAKTQYVGDDDDDEDKIVLFTDSNYAGDIIDRKSTGGYAFYFNGNLVTWGCNKQPIVALSSTEAEYIALSTAAKEATWLRQHTSGLIKKSIGAINILVDNQSAIKLAKNPETHKRSKHIDVRYHHIRELVEKKEVKIEHVRTTEQVADILTKPLTADKHQQIRGKMGLVNKLLLFSTALLACVTNIQATMQNSVPVLWDAIDHPVAHGYEHIQIGLEFVSPCLLLSNQTVHHELLETAIATCDEWYQEYFISEIEEMCPTKNWGVIKSRVKRIIPIIIIGVCLLAGGAVIGTGIAGTVIAAKNSETIANLSSQLATEKGIREEMNRMIEENSMKIDDLREKFNKLVNTLEKSDKDRRELKYKSVSQSYAISYIMSRLTQGSLIIKEAIRKWSKKEVHGPLIDYLNITMPCGKLCPYNFAQAKSCELETTKKKLFMDFYIPQVNKDMLMLKADPFNLMQRRDNMTCTLKYSGPEYAVISLASGCVYPQNQAVGRRNLVMAPKDECKPPTPTTATKNFAVSHCVETQQQDEMQFIQVKADGAMYHIYCPGSTYTVDRFKQNCPDEVFMLPLTQSFHINDQFFKSKQVSIDQKEELEPLFSEKANRYIGTNVDWDEFKAAPTHTVYRRSSYQEKGDDTMQKTSYVVTFVILGIIIALVMVIVYFIRKTRNERILAVQAVEMEDRNPRLDRGDENPALENGE